MIRRIERAGAALLFAVALLAPPAARAQEQPIETEARRDEALIAAFAERTAGLVDATVKLETAEGDPVGYGVALQAGQIVTALQAVESLPRSSRKSS